MFVTVHIPEPLRRYSDGDDAVQVEGRSVGEALDALFDRLPELRVRIVRDDGSIQPYLILVTESGEVDRAAWRDVGLVTDEVLSIIPAVEGGAPSRDVRMRGFQDRATVEAARGRALEGLEVRGEVVPPDEAAGRVLAADVVSTVDVPSFDRSAMDGYAVRARETFGASQHDPVELDVVGEARPGQGLEGTTVAAGQACRIMTGAPVPEGADAVVMAEDVREEGRRVLVEAAVTPGKNVGRTGEDIAAGTVVLAAGRRLRPQDAAILCSIGERAPVVRRPRIGILATGNELLEPGERPRDGRIVDSNTPMLKALAERDGGEVVTCRRLADEPDLIRDALLSADVDVLLCNGGSSVGREDWLPVLVKEVGELPIHGVAMRPSAPTGIGSIGDMRVFLLPGNPVSCLCAYDFFAGPAIRFLGGRDDGWPHPTRTVRLERRITSMVGRVDYVRVLVRDGSATPLAISGASILSSTTRADGFCIIPQDSEGMAEGEELVVRLYDGVCS